MAGSKSCVTGNDFYGAYDAQEVSLIVDLDRTAQCCWPHGRISLAPGKVNISGGRVAKITTYKHGRYSLTF